MPLRRLSLFAVLGVLFAVAAAPAQDAPGPVEDKAQLFNEEAVEQADTELLDLKGIYDLAFVVRTVPQPPSDVQKELATAKNTAAKNKILHEWAEKEARDAGGKGVYILVCKDAARGWLGRVYGCVVVTVSDDAPSEKFTAADARSLHDRLRWFTRSGDKAKNDAILLAALDQVREDLKYNHLPPFPWLGVGGVMGGVLGLWGLLGLVRMRLQAADKSAGPAPQRPGLFAALLGGMFGSAAGHWIYDSLFIAASAVPGAEPTQAAAPSELQLTANEKKEAIQTEAAEPPPMTKAERMDLAAHDHPTEEAPTPPESAPF